MPEAPKSKRRDTNVDLQNAQRIFQDAIDRITHDIGGNEHLTFPKEIMWLGGAPGAGKGTNTPFIKRARDITAAPIVMSELLDTPEMKAIKDAGHLVGDPEAVEVLLRELLKKDYESGVVVDGFPRTKVQVECVRLLYNKMNELRREFFDTPIGPQFRRPIFRITVLYVREQVSIDRQLSRGREIQEHNKRVEETGDGEKLALRPTDLDEHLARERYSVFKRETFDALNSLRNSFHYHFIDANRPIDEVEEKIEAEFAYQSTLELGQDTVDSIRNIPVASELTAHTRFNLVRRLDNYRHRHAELFAKVINFIEQSITPVLHRQAASGRAICRSDDPVLENDLSIDMVVDVLTERGYSPVPDVKEQIIPQRIDPQTNAIINATRKIWIFTIHFNAPNLRR